MVGEVFNTTEVLEAVSPELVERLAPAITIFKAVGIAFIVYVCYLVIMAILNFRNRNRVKKIEKKVNEIDIKLDALLGKRKKKEKKR